MTSTWCWRGWGATAWLAALGLVEAQSTSSSSQTSCQMTTVPVAGASY